MTQLKDATVSFGSWSPDGRSLLFDATIGERTHIYVVPVNGGPAKRLTDGDASEIESFRVGARTRWPVDFARTPDVLQIYDFAERRVRTLGTLATRIGSFGATHFFTASRDGRWALISHVDRWDRDEVAHRAAEEKEKAEEEKAAAEKKAEEPPPAKNPRDENKKGAAATTPATDKGAKPGDKAGAKPDDKAGAKPADAPKK